MSTSLVVLGPTASGKSDVAMSVATDPGLVEHGPFEIVAVDAMQVYRRMDIGTAKPTADDRDRVPHHLLDLVDPDHEFAVAEFVDAATTAAAEIAARGNRALLVGGTGLYLRALTDPMEIPGTWPVVRAALEARLAHESVEALHAELTALDPDAAAKMEPTNARRVVRARGVRRFGAAVQLVRAGPRPLPTGPVRAGGSALAPPGARAADRDLRPPDGRGRTGGRGRSLVERFPGLSRTARQALGYKEVIEHLEGLCSLDEAVATVVVRTRQFAVRQAVVPSHRAIRWLDIHDDPVAEAVPVIAATLMGTR
ncbi:MAG: tRNA (adenosine(37)-N6)-dimethylallyltransferase MiaA [Ilumatobacteraceae bacterium]